GTRGYGFLNAVNGLFVAAEGKSALDALYREFTGETAALPEVIHRCKTRVTEESMASEVNSLSHRLDRIAERNRHTRDFTLNGLEGGVREGITALRVYRTYGRPDAPGSERDRRFIEAAVEESRDRSPRTAGPVFDFLRDTLLLRNLERFPEEERPALVEWVRRFQQITGPVMAKGVEDTAFYAYNRLASL